MPKFLCERQCQAHMPPGKDADGNPKGKIFFFERGQVIEASANPRPECFTQLGKKEIDFTTASEAELLESEWDFKDAAKAVKAAYKVTLKNSNKKSDVVDAILDARYRHVDV